MACLIVLVASIIALVRPLPKVGLGTRKRALGGVGIAFALFILTAAVMPAPKAAADIAQAKRKAAPAGTVAASNDQIAEVNAYAETKFASVKVDLQQGWDGSDLPVQAAMVVEAAGKAIKAGASDIPQSVDRIDFWFTAPLVDQYGKESRSKVLQFEIKPADLRAVQYENIAPQGLLEFADDVYVRVAARQAVADYCADNERTNRLFCAKAAR
ncbi:hypothetical protein [Sphingobium sp. MI1205]|uniref:hypothetical protein n=1 Tax=Sphingobium sp. MI1205 TaxID=407020 RepID=UPI00119D9B5A|nr:hypothetical protein [Sphingobium sp. MI1205]